MAMLQEQANTERICGGHKSHAQAQDMAQLTAELIAGRGVAPMGLQVEKAETYDGAKHRDVDTWLFQVPEHMSLMCIPTNSQVGYAASLLRGMRPCSGVNNVKVAIVWTLGKLLRIASEDNSGWIIWLEGQGMISMPSSKMMNNLLQTSCINFDKSILGSMIYQKQKNWTSSFGLSMGMLGCKWN